MKGRPAGGRPFLEQCRLVELWDERARCFKLKHHPFNAQTTVQFHEAFTFAYKIKAKFSHCTCWNCFLIRAKQNFSVAFLWTRGKWPNVHYRRVNCIYLRTKLPGLQIVSRINDLKHRHDIVSFFANLYTFIFEGATYYD